MQNHYHTLILLSMLQVIREVNVFPFLYYALVTVKVHIGIWKKPCSCTLRASSSRVKSLSLLWAAPVSHLADLVTQTFVQPLYYCKARLLPGPGGADLLMDSTQVTVATQRLPSISFSPKITNIVFTSLWIPRGKRPCLILWDIV